LNTVRKRHILDLLLAILCLILKLLLLVLKGIHEEGLDNGFLDLFRHKCGFVNPLYQTSSRVLVEQKRFRSSLCSSLKKRGVGRSATKMADDVLQRLDKRHEERLQNIEKRKLENDRKADPDESKDMFLVTFSKEHAELENLLKKSEILGEDKNAISDHFEKLSTKCQQLQKYLSDSSMFLPSYNIKASQDKLSALQQAIIEEREKKLPKKKFAFRSRKKEIDSTTVVDGKSQVGV